MGEKIKPEIKAKNLRSLWLKLTMFFVAAFFLSLIILGSFSLLFDPTHELSFSAFNPLAKNQDLVSLVDNSSPFLATNQDKVRILGEENQSQQPTADQEEKPSVFQSLDFCKQCIDTRNIKDEAITGEKIKDGSIDTKQLDGGISLKKLNLSQLNLSDNPNRRPGHFSLHQGDAYISGRLEVDSDAWFDRMLYVKDSGSISTLTSTRLSTNTANISNILSNSHLAIRGRLPNEDFLNVFDFVNLYFNPSGYVYFGDDAHETTPADPTHAADGDVYIKNDLEVGGTIYGNISGSFAPSGDVDMDGNRIYNIGSAGSGFSATGGLTLNDALAISSGGASIVGGLNVDSGKLYVDATSGNVGVGTTGPGYMLEVQGGNVNLSNTLYTDLTNTRVGIGTNAPRMSLEIAHSVASGFSGPDDMIYLVGLYGDQNENTPDNYGPGIRFRQTIGGYRYRDVGRIATVKHGSFSDIIFAPTPNLVTLTEIMRIQGNGNVGINTSSPSYKLHVVGDGYFSTNLTVGGTLSALSITQNGTSLDNTYVNVSGDTMTGSLNLPSNGLAVGTSQLVVSGGNVGIGTTEPIGTLEVSNDGSADNIILRKSGVGNNLLSWYDTDGSFAGRIDDSGNLRILDGTRFTPAYTFNSDTDTGFYRAAENSLKVTTGGNNLFVFGSNQHFGVGISDNAPVNTLTVSGAASIGASYSSLIAPSNGLIIEGNVGIGTTSPTYKLDVNGTGRFSGALTLGSTLTAGGNINLNGNWLSGDGDSEGIYVNSSGNVGIGTTGPISILNIYKNSPIANENLFVIGTSDNASRFTIDEDGDLYAAGTISSLVAQPSYNSLDEGLVLYLPFSETSGTIPYDRSYLNNSTGFVSSETTFVTNGKFGNAVHFEGDDDYPGGGVSISGSNFNFSTDKDFAFSFWIKTGSGNDEDDKAFIMTTSVLTGFWSYCSGNKMAFYYRAGGNYTLRSSNNDICDGTWHLVTINIDRDSQYSVYVDGKMDVSGGISGVSWNSNNMSIKLGVGDHWAYQFDGYMDEVRMYNRLLSTNEIRRLYDQGVHDNAPYVSYAGNVGIGTTNPAHKLEISANTDVPFYISSSNADWAGMEFTATSVTGKPYLQLFNSNAAVNKTGLLYMGLDGSMNISTNGDSSGTKLTVLSGGNVGIGTTSPDSKLEVEGDTIHLDSGAHAYFNLDSASNAYESLIRFMDNGSTRFTMGLDNDSSHSVFSIGDNALANKWLSIASTGALTLGSTLTAGGNINLNGNWLSGDGDSEGIYVNSSGNVGIGTTGPISILNIYKNSPIANENLFVIGTSDNASRFTIDEDGDLYAAGTISSLVAQPSYNSLDEGLVLYLPFSETSGSTVYDRTANGNDGVKSATRTEWTTNGKFGNAIWFDGSDNWPPQGVSIQNNKNLEFGTSQDFSVSFWVKSGSNNDVNDVIFEMVSAEGGPSLYPSDSKIKFLFQKGGGNTYVISQSEILDGGWHLVTVSYDRDGYQKIYVDGKFDTQVSLVGFDTNMINYSRIKIGIGYHESVSFGGTIDEFRIYNRLLSTNEIRRLYDQGVHDNAPYVSYAGNVGIGTTSPNYKLDVNGGFRSNSSDVFLSGLTTGDGTALYVTAGNQVVKYSSSRRYKEDFHSYDPDIEKLKLLSPQTFKWNKTTATPGKEDFGLIAEDVYEVFPELVKKNSQGMIESVDYSKISVILLKGFQYHDSKIENIENTIKLIGSDIDALESGIAANKGEIDALGDNLEQLSLSVDNLNSSLSTFNMILSDHEQRLQTLESRVNVAGASIEMPTILEGWSDVLDDEKIKFDAEGNFKAKEIEAEGLIKPGKFEEAPECDDENEGGIYYNITDKNFYGCDGENWKELDGNVMESEEN